MAMNAERRIAAAGIASGVFAIFAFLLIASSMMLGLGARDKGVVTIASTGDLR